MIKKQFLHLTRLSLNYRLNNKPYAICVLSFEYKIKTIHYSCWFTVIKLFKIKTLCNGIFYAHLGYTAYVFQRSVNVDAISQGEKVKSLLVILHQKQKFVALYL